MLDYEIKNLKEQYKTVTGVDEAGRGAWAGPVVVAAVTLPVDFQDKRINDSKKLTHKKRKELFEYIKKVAIDYKIVVVGQDYDSKYNPKQISKEGMKEAINNLEKLGGIVITDYEKIDLENINQINLVKGDGIAISVGAASILAKYFRDSLMEEYSFKHPEYKWDQNKGYGTKSHQEALLKFGVTELHRKHYKPIRQIIENKKIES
ncbi:ribonuclease HII [Mycoplasmopsis glycophila]|uniref:ribonuclease HII n=1 Tax=Mycoplasmopsis glycophila TaxID=171285 RepID=UPI00048053B6|nr:ribonuclease HII [Mycoplasmopsis glycophila]